jgi:tetratricopeptide (TPR) repeat protein
MVTKFVFAFLVSSLYVQAQDDSVPLHRAQAALAKFEGQQAVALFAAALRINPRDEAAFLGRGRSWIACAESGYPTSSSVTDDDRALADFDHAIALSPQDPQAYIGRALAHENKGHDLAKIQFPNFDGARMEFDKSEADFTKAIQIAPKDANAYLQRGDMYSNDMRPEHRSLARADYSRCIQLNPRDSAAYSGRADAEDKKSDLRQALADITKAIELAPRDDLGDDFQERGIIRERMGDYVGAAADLTRDTQVAPFDLTGFEFLAEVLSSSPEPSARDGKRAILVATKACELGHWNNATDVEMLAAAYAETGDFASAIKWQKKAMSYAPNPGNLDTERLALYEAHHPYRAPADEYQ